MLNGDQIHELFYVETDFGNHMKLSWSELTNMFEVVGVRDYDQWKADRDQLRNQPSYIDKDMHCQAIDADMPNLRKDFP